MTEKKEFLNDVLQILTEAQDKFDKLREEALQKSEEYKKDAERHLIEEKTVQAMSVAIKSLIEKEKGE